MKIGTHLLLVLLDAIKVIGPVFRRGERIAWVTYAIKNGPRPNNGREPSDSLVVGARWILGSSPRIASRGHVCPN